MGLKQKKLNKLKKLKKFKGENIMEEKSYATPEDLILGDDCTEDIELDIRGKKIWLTIKPVNMGEAIMVQKASKGDQAESGIWLVKSALINPKLTTEQIKKMPLGTIGKLVEKINEISGVDSEKTDTAIKAF